MGNNDPYTYDISFEKTIEQLKDIIGFEYDNEEENEEWVQNPTSI